MCMSKSRFSMTLRKMFASPQGQAGVPPQGPAAGGHGSSHCVGAAAAALEASFLIIFTL